ENAELVELPKNSKGMIYIIESVKENWVLLKSGAEDQSNLQLKEGTEIGWMKWYCGDSMRIDILDNYGLEDYFYED
ncbi:MAG: hypothetical protein KDE33_18370, partial [Bacteroidetes bacterium]|nr:hypothetical protein [Bacteroidota bacterium]